jgi:predicted metal-dependent hydrolase
MVIPFQLAQIGPCIRNSVDCHSRRPLSKGFRAVLRAMGHLVVGGSFGILRPCLLGQNVTHFIGDPPISITLRRSARAQRFSLRVAQADGRVTLSLPARARESDALDFARAQEAWLRAALAKMPQGLDVVLGGKVPVEGALLTITAGQGRSVRIQDGALIVPGDSDRTSARIAAYLKVRARDRLAAASDLYAGQIGRKVTQISLRDTRSRWGSCTSTGALMYNWRLIMAPPAVLDYVAAHEVAHMIEMNHAPAFWDVVARLYPGWRTQRAWLKRHGGQLQAIRF